jgi:hypothetical protein
VLNEHNRREAVAELLLNAGDEFGREQRVTAKLEEAVVDSDARAAE